MKRLSIQPFMEVEKLDAGIEVSFEIIFLLC